MDLNRAELLAKDLIDEHINRRITEYGYWTFEWSDRKSFLGQCNYTTNTISLSRPHTIVNNEISVRDTILHEVAHALTKGDGHGRQWKLMAQRLGANPSRTNIAELSRGKYYIQCEPCNYKHEFYRLPKRTYLCVHCKKSLPLIERGE